MYAMERPLLEWLHKLGTYIYNLYDFSNGNFSKDPTRLRDLTIEYS